MSARGLMVLGTASHVGKSLLATALCRILRQDGYRVAPFKAQNMSLNSAATLEGGEIGRAQALQAEAARIAATVDMNPVLIKPTSDRRSQIVALGTIWGESDAGDYHRRRIAELFPLVEAAYARLAARYDVIVLEGAGSPAEINLRESDLANMRMAHAADATCLLVGDIDRGGVFASLYGTLALLDDADRARIAGVAINKFRGDLDLLRPGLATLEGLLGKRCFGVVPHLRDVGLEDEDGVGREALTHHIRRPWHDRDDDPERRTRVAAIAWPLLANATDFDTLAREPSVEFAYVSAPAALEGADVIVLPGTKATLAALRWLRAGGFAAALAAARTHALIVGICGGMQALGTRVDDPFGVEGGGSADGLGMLALRTRMAPRKIAEQVAGTTYARRIGATRFDTREFEGYEIHVGATTYESGARPFARLVRASDGTTLDDGAVSADGRVVGTYVHGLFGNDDLRHRLLGAARAGAALAPARTLAALGATRAASLDRLADHVRSALDVPALLAATVTAR